jgi:two-component system response regulator CpxR
MSAHILIADDDRELCALLADYLRSESFHVEAVHDGDAAIARLNDPAQRPDLLILDVMMPGRDGLATLRELRQKHPIPVIMLSARGEPVDRVVGLELGADDYLAKPCLPRELLARVRAQLRRNAPPEMLTVGVLQLHAAARRATLGGKELMLTGAEFSLLFALAARAGQIVDKSLLTREALGREIERFDRSIDVHVSRLRRKLMESSPQAPRIESIRGQGYQLLVADE